MNWRRLAGVGSLLALVGSNVYWRRRERTVREGLSVSHDWEAAAGVTQRDLYEAAEVADTSPDELTGEIERLHERIEAQERDLAQYSTRMGSVRARWTRLWWDALTTEAAPADEPHALGVVIPDGETADAEALAKRAAEHEEVVTVVGAETDRTFVVKVSASLTDTVAAVELAQELTDVVGGGAGGSDRSATGGGATGDLESAIDELIERIENRPPFV